MTELRRIPAYEGNIDDRFVHADKHGRLVMSEPAGGVGGGVTGSVDHLLSEAQTVGFHKRQADRARKVADDLQTVFEVADKVFRLHRSEDEKSKVHSPVPPPVHVLPPAPPVEHKK